MKIQLFIAVVVAAALTSCATQKINYRESSARIIEPNQGAIITPMIADMELISETKITPYVEEFTGVTVTPYVITHMDGYKRIALLNAAKKYNADAIVGALLDIATTPNGKLQITVTGYPAKYVGFRKATSDDVWMLEMYRIIYGSPTEAVISDAPRSRQNSRLL